MCVVTRILSVGSNCSLKIYGKNFAGALNGVSALNPILRRALHGWFLASRGLTLGVRGAVIDPHDNVFLIRHTYVAGWQLPGGGIEIGEDALLALSRELREEAEIEIGPGARLHGIYHNRHVSRRDHVLVYEIRDFTVLRPKQPDREIAEAGFFPLRSLPEATTPGTRARLDEIVAGRAGPEAW
jgi:8-oxo-dGTP pyrophosphatase MutT (NUDIX family)